MPPDQTLKRESAPARPPYALPRRTKKKEDVAMSDFASWCVKHQIGLSMNLLALLGLTHVFFPKSHKYTTKFFSQSYYNPRTGEYGIGKDDVYQILFYMTIFTALRAGAMDYVLAPLARWWGITKRKTIDRFSEQGYLVLYYAIFWPMGMYIYCNSDYYMNLTNLWTNWPNREVSGLMRVYMLAQLAFWCQQILVINIEERRKDHWQMFAHHVVTIILITTSWRYGYTRVGNLILILMDGVDIVFSAAKLLKYTGFDTACDVFFGLFMLSWVIARHFVYLTVCWSIYKETDRVIPKGCFRGPGDKIEGPFPVPTERGLIYILEPLVSNDALVCFSEPVKWGFLASLLFLQAILLVWLVAIFRVAVKVLRGTGAEDTRSDDEEDEEDIEADGMTYQKTGATLTDAVAGRGGKTTRSDDDNDEPIEEEVGVEDIDFKGWGRRSGIKRQASSATGVSLPGHSDRKELLGRIGCEKQVE
ncbi:uncharacterized protein PpBr36_09496 [Pyricularia pennisetigena]|uniref:uncharacterized protein n=1 Tax=Pyricularia pennisetigena TaxID=1578925 RepID=UPI00114DBEE9|nr:uncharacterized protein PpBr36_09496 [Pyricularia pennisetigena]TLS21729.1 hypothetical protein PpBr36_09496 [Pyricularia pennisetigena]